MSTVEKVLLGAAGGIAALLVKFLGQDYAALQQFMQQGNEAAVALMAYAYLILAGPLLFLGGLVAYVIDEADPKKLVIAAISAPAIVPTWAGGPPAETGSVQPAIQKIEPQDPDTEQQNRSGATLYFFAPAYAQETEAETLSESELVTFGNAVRMFFGTAPEGLAEAADPSARDVQALPSGEITDFDVILETMSKEKAERTAETLQEEYPDLDVRVAPATE